MGFNNVQMKEGDKWKAAFWRSLTYPTDSGGTPLDSAGLLFAEGPAKMAIFYSPESAGLVTGITGNRIAHWTAQEWVLKRSPADSLIII